MERRQHTGVEVEKIGDDPTRVRSRYKNVRKRYQNRLNSRNHFDCHLSNLMDYAEWEESQKIFRRARILWESAASMYENNSMAWLNCAKFYLRTRRYPEAKKVLERGLSALPNAELLWRLYIKMEEKLVGVDEARKLFDKWIDRKPLNASCSYISFELKHGNVDRAREGYERLVKLVPEVSSWIFYANFEVRLGQISKARIVYERAMIVCRDDPVVENLLNSYAYFEKDIERAKDGVEDVVNKSLQELRVED